MQHTEAPLMLSVSGARGIVGKTMTPEVAAAYGAAFGSFLKATTEKKRPKVVVGLDGRISGPPLEAAAIGGLLGLYGFYLFYVGATPMMKVPKDKAVVYTVVAVVCAIVINIVVNAVTGTLMRPPTPSPFG